MKFLVDNQLPLHLAKHLRSLGHDCAHVIDLGLDAADDITVWARCSTDGSILISKDEDFVFLAARPGDTGRLLWVRLGNCRNAALTAAFDRVLDAVLQSFQSGQRVVELR